MNSYSEFDAFLFEITHYNHTSHPEEIPLLKQVVDDARNYICLSSRYVDRNNHPTFKKSERPDIIYECDDYIMGIECFEFDSSNKDRKGSKQRQLEATFDKDYKANVFDSKRMLDNSTQLSSRIIQPNYSIKDYINSLLDTFSSHQNSISDYRQNLSSINKSKPAFLAFYIKDVTALGSYVFSNNTVEPIHPFSIKEFIEQLHQTKGLDFLIIGRQLCATRWNSYSIDMIELTEQTLSEAMKEVYDFSKDTYICYDYTRLRIDRH